MLRAGLFNEGIETTGAEIAFDLSIPELCFELHKPLAEPTKILGRKLADCLFDLFHGHTNTLP
jgi:hypothetical protein